MHGPLCLPLRCIATPQLWVGIWPISSHTPYLTYMCSPLCLPLATLHLSSTQDTHGLSSPPHMAYCPASHLVRTPRSLLDWSFYQESMHGDTPSGLQVLIGKWVPLRHHWPGLHVVLCMSSTWSSQPSTTIFMMNLWKAVVHLQ